jgi:hypothetical protein
VDLPGSQGSVLAICDQSQAWVAQLYKCPWKESCENRETSSKVSNGGRSWIGRTIVETRKGTRLVTR